MCENCTVHMCSLYCKGELSVCCVTFCYAVLTQLHLHVVHVPFSSGHSKWHQAVVQWCSRSRMVAKLVFTIIVRACMRACMHACMHAFWSTMPWAGLQQDGTLSVGITLLTWPNNRMWYDYLPNYRMWYDYLFQCQDGSPIMLRTLRNLFQFILIKLEPAQRNLFSHVRLFNCCALNVAS